MNKESVSSEHCMVVGAGIVGVATGIWLARAGVKVTLIDRQAPGEGTSHGNAGVLASCSMVPVTTPGLVRKAPGLLLNKDFPLFMRWSYLPRIAPWLWHYLGYANDADTQRISEHLAFIVGDSVDQHQELSGNTEADQWLHPSDYQFAYRTKSDYKADAYVWSLRRRHGFEPEILTGAQVREKEPALGPDIDVLAIVKNHGHITSPGLYVKSLARVFESLGGTIVQGAVEDFTLVDGRVTAVLTDHGPFECNSAVVATGVWSKPLCERFGLNIPLESERGYHVIFKNPSTKVTAPTMIASGKFVATPMHDGMRCAGIVELGGLDAGPSSEPIDLLMRHVKRTFPDLGYSEAVEWMGHRPAPADSLPFIGEIGTTGVYTAFGHHHIGLTGGPKTGRLIAELICRERTPEGLEAYRPDRFS
ncbi:MAG: NAD(P)/FAD-dependent oxidoreductase [Granulosicoccus sp.]